MYSKVTAVVYFKIVLLSQYSLGKLMNAAETSAMSEDRRLRLEVSSLHDKREVENLCHVLLSRGYM